MGTQFVGKTIWSIYLPCGMNIPNDHFASRGSKCQPELREMLNRKLTLICRFLVGSRWSCCQKKHQQLMWRGLPMCLFNSASDLPSPPTSIAHWFHPMFPIFFRILSGGFLKSGYPQWFIHFNGVFLCKPSNYWGTPMTMEPPWQASSRRWRLLEIRPCPDGQGCLPLVTCYQNSRFFNGCSSPKSDNVGFDTSPDVAKSSWYTEEKMHSLRYMPSCAHQPARSVITSNMPLLILARILLIFGTVRHGAGPGWLGLQVRGFKARISDRQGCS